MQWHRRLRHLNVKYVSQLEFINLIKICRLDSNEVTIFESCTINKMHRQINRQLIRFKLNRKATRKRQRIHIDLTDDDQIIRTSRSKQYVIIFVNDYTDYTWVYLVRTKNEYKRVLKKFILMLKIEEISIQYIRFDNAEKNVNDFIKALLFEHDIQWEFIVFNNSYQNNVTKRAFRTIFNRVRACLYDFKLSWYLWEEVCHTVIYFKNLNSCKHLINMISFEIWKDHKSILQHLHSFDIFCIVKKKKAKKLND